MSPSCEWDDLRLDSFRSADISLVDKCGRGPRSCVRYYGARAHVSCAPLPTILSPLILPFVSRKKNRTERSEIMLLLDLTNRSLSIYVTTLYIYASRSRFIFLQRARKK